MTELKPCPYCGKDMQDFVCYVVDDHCEHVVACKNCGAEGPNAMTREDAADMWNLRRVQVGVNGEWIILNCHGGYGISEDKCTNQ